MESVGFGIYMITSVSCFRLFFTQSRQRGSARVDWPMLIIFLIFFAKTTSSVALHLYLNLRMVTRDSHDAAAQFRDGSNPINISKVFAAYWYPLT